jgi:hypothetical protein
MPLFSGLVEKMLNRDRRKAERMPAPELSAYFWAVGTPTEHSIRDISATGLYLVTEETWYPGTLIMMTLQNKEANGEDATRSIVLQTKVMRRCEDGVGLAFVLAEPRAARRAGHLLNSGADRKTLDRFLKGFRSEHGLAVVHNVVAPK